MKQKKSLGQHFLNDEAIARIIANSFSDNVAFDVIVEVGTGVGILTRQLLKLENKELWVIEIDDRLVEIIKQGFPTLNNRIIKNDILKVNFNEYFKGAFGVIGNFPYQISSQIVFKVLEYKEQVPQMVGMFQREVAQRIAAPPGTKDYGVISVLVQAYYKASLLFEVGPEKFNPPPKVHSAVIKLERYQTSIPGCDDGKFKTVVKTAFNQRRKMLRNSIKSLTSDVKFLKDEFLQRRPEQLSVEEFVWLTNKIYI